MDPLQATLLVAEATSGNKHLQNRSAGPTRPARLVPTIRNATSLVSRRVGTLIATGRPRALSPADPATG